MKIRAVAGTNFKILRGVIELEKFGVEELCLNTGLRSSQVYRELSVLQKEGLLRSLRAPQRAGEGAARHRPPKIYMLASEEATSPFAINRPMWTGSPEKLTA